MIKEAEIQSFLESKLLKSIKIYSLRENYFVKDEGEAYMIDGAIQLELEGDEYFTLGLSEELEMIDAQAVEASEILGSQFYEELRINDFDVLQYTDQQISYVDIEWGWYQEYDDDFILKEEKEYLPVALKINFESGMQLYLAGLTFAFNGTEIVQMSYDLQSFILISNHFEHDIHNPFNDTDIE